MASCAVTSILSVALCILLLGLTTSSVSSMPAIGRNGHCFRQRERLGQRGKCQDEIPVPANRTMLEPEDCCMLGGVGWSDKANGKRCVDACQETEAPRQDDPKEKPLVEESLEAVDVKIPPNDTVTWSEWSQWSSCSTPCGVGNITRTRTCLVDRVCNGTIDEEIKECDAIISCPVDGGWTSWSDWSVCDHTNPCRPVQTSTRLCANSDGPCNGRSTRTRPCFRAARIGCRVNGGWNAWSAWTDCTSNVCDEVGWTWRIRECDNPEPSGGGADCGGLFLETASCNGPC